MKWSLQAAFWLNWLCFYLPHSDFFRRVCTANDSLRFWKALAHIKLNYVVSESGGSGTCQGGKPCSLSRLRFRSDHHLTIVCCVHYSCCHSYHNVVSSTFCLKPYSTAFVSVFFQVVVAFQNETFSLKPWTENFLSKIIVCWKGTSKEIERKTEGDRIGRKRSKERESERKKD